MLSEVKVATRSDVWSQAIKILCGFLAVPLRMELTRGFALWTRARPMTICRAWTTPDL